MQVQVGSFIYPLTMGQPLPVPAGSSLRVFYSFSYKVEDTTPVSLWASLYSGHWLPGVEINRVEQAQTKTTITLDRALDWQTYQGYVDINIGSGVKAGVYGLLVELRGFTDDTVNDCLEVTAAPGITEWVGPLIMLALLGMMIPVMTGMAEDTE